MVKFTLNSWTLQEYQSCVSNKEFVQCVRSALDSSADLNNNKKDLLLAKYYFTESCCRFMFQFDTASVIHFLHEKIHEAPGMLPYLENRVGDTSEHAVNALLCRFTNKEQCTHILCYS